MTWVTCVVWKRLDTIEFPKLMMSVHGESDLLVVLHYFVSGCLCY